MTYDEWKEHNTRGIVVWCGFIFVLMMIACIAAAVVKGGA